MGKKPWRIRILSFIAVGFLIGILLGLFHKGESSLLAPVALGRLKEAGLDPAACLYEIVKSRGGVAIFLLVASTTYLAPFMEAGTALWIGMSIGIFQTQALGLYGLKGILLLPAVTMPQFLVYLPVYYFLILWCERLYEMIYLKNPWKKGNAIAGLALILAAMAFGIFLECMIGQRVFHAFLNIF